MKHSTNISKPSRTNNLCCIKRKDYPHLIWNAYNDKELKCSIMVCEVPIETVSQISNVITSHIISKVKLNDDGSLKIKARIALHGNKYKD